MQEHEAEDLQNPAQLRRQQALQWAMVVGVLLGAFPFVQAHARFGTRNTLFWAAILSMVATAAVPLAVHTGFWSFFGVRFLQVCQGIQI